MAEAQPFTVNPTLDAERLGERFRASGRLQIADFLVPAEAEALRAELLARGDWALILNAGEKVFDIPRSGWAEMSEEQRARLDELVIQSARSGFHYRYESIRVPDEADGRSGSDLLSAFVRFMASEEALSFFRQVTGLDDIAFADGQATAYSPGHFLTAHTDDVEGKQRRAAYVLGLSPEWHPEWGGLLMFHDADDNIEEAFTPRMGALRIFSVPVRHSVSYVNPIAPEPRLSVTGWLRAERPGG
jgi:Rps23 Pro-64 3,4-dihydroxylase Tpa1-like proline 4-hydroxylase